VLEQVTPSGAIAEARCELAGQFLDDLRNLDAQLRETKKKLAAAVRASRTTLTGIFGVGPVIAGTVIGDIGISRFATRDQFAAYNGTAPRCPQGGGRWRTAPCASTAASRRERRSAISYAAIRAAPDSPICTAVDARSALSRFIQNRQIGCRPRCLPTSFPRQSLGARHLEVEPEDRWLCG
jgi:transposase